ncbi:MAG: VirD4-like conjugal transfer protein, CD1115 family [Desulfotomaculales bacterium]
MQFAWRVTGVHVLATMFILAAAGLLAWQAKILFLLALMASGGWFLCRHGGAAQRAGAALLPLALGLLLAWGAAGITHSGLKAALALKRQAPPPAPSYRAWIGAAPARSAADRAGRVAALSGGLLGLLAAWAARPRPRHGPGIVNNRPVLEGGWASLADVADKCDFGPPREGAGGVPLGRLQGQIVRLNPEKGKIKIAGHTFIVGATGTGKSYTCIRNLIIAAVCDGESVVVTDPKGELFEDMALWLKARGYRVLGFNVQNPRFSHRWNMLLECRDFEEMMDLAEWLISAAGDDHAFFSGGEKNILAAAAAFARWALPEGQRHMRAALSVLSWPQEALDAAYTAAFRAGKVPPPAFETWKAAQGHYSNYIEGIRNKVRAITKGPLAALTAASDFTLESLGREKTALFLVLPDEGQLHSLYVPFYTFMFRRLREEAEAAGGRLPVPVRFVLDEFANIGKIPDMDKVCALGRSRGIMVQIAVQNIGQLQGLYRKNNAWEAVVGNCPVKMCLSTDDRKSAAFFTELLGRARVRDVKESRDVTTPWDALEYKRRESTRDVDLMAPYEILQLPEDDCVVLLRGKKPLYLQKIAWTELPQAGEIRAAGRVRPEGWLPEIPQEVELPPYPEAGEVPREPERTRGGKVRVKTKPQAMPDGGEIDAVAAEELGI